MYEGEAGEEKQDCQWATILFYVHLWMNLA